MKNVDNARKIDGTKKCCPDSGEPGRKPCSKPANDGDKQGTNNMKTMLGGVALIVCWWLLYSNLIPFSVWVTYSLLHIAPATHLGSAVEFFVYDTLKILLLLVLMVYAIALLRASLSVTKVRRYLEGRGKTAGYALGSIFGAVTPFCSCSSVPLFLGFTTAGIPLGVTMAFLITSPIINEVAVVVLWGLLGWKFTVSYVVIGLAVGVFGGVFMEAIRAERWFQPYLLAQLRLLRSGKDFQRMAGAAEGEECAMDFEARHAYAVSETRDIFRRVWLWVVLGVALGAVLHGYVPEQWVTGNLGAGQWWSVPAAVLVGIPLYSNVTGIIPVMESLLLKGLPVGTTLALCMSTVAVSLPELLMLRQVMRWRLLAVFVVLLLVLFTVVGWLFNAIAPYVF